MGAAPSAAGVGSAAGAGSSGMGSSSACARLHFNLELIKELLEGITGRASWVQRGGHQLTHQPFCVGLHAPPPLAGVRSPLPTVECLWVLDLWLACAGFRVRLKLVDFGLIGCIRLMGVSGPLGPCLVGLIGFRAKSLGV